MTTSVAADFRPIIHHGNRRKLVTFEDHGLEEAIRRARAEDPPGEVGPVLDDRPGTYSVRSRSAMLEGRTAYWRVPLDVETGGLAGPHNCPPRAEKPSLNVQCRHIALAVDAWRTDHDPFIRRLREGERMTTESTALAPYDSQPRAMTTYLPSSQDVADVMALATTLKETRGAAIPYQLDTVAKVAAVIIAGREAGFPPMAALANFYVVNGSTFPRAQAMTAMVERAGGILTYAEMSDERCTATLQMHGRPPLTLTYTIEQAKKSGLVHSAMRQRRDKQGNATGPAVETSPWVLFPADMLVAKCVTRLCRRGAASVINAIEAGQVRVIDVVEQAPSVYGAEVDSEDRPALDVDTGEVLEDSPVVMGEADLREAARTEPEPGWRGVPYREASADKAKYLREFAAFQKALAQYGGIVPANLDLEAVSLGQILDAASGAV